MKVEEPALPLHAIERRVPLDPFVHAGDGARDERVEAAPYIALPARHGCDVSLHWSVALGLLDLRVASCEESRLYDLRGLPGGLASHRVHSNAPARCPLRHLLAYGSMNKYRPVSMRKASGSSGEYVIQAGG